MTRKRFVKLLMARGYSRNEANSRASVVVSARLTYEQGYFAALLESGDSEAWEAVQAVCAKIVAVVQSIAEACISASKAIMEASPSLAEMAQKNAAE